MVSPNDVLNYWFGPIGSIKEIVDTRNAIWWSKNDAVDQEITHRFKQTVDDVFCGKSNNWLDTNEGTLASIICLDQFPRNIYRGTPKSFSYDGRALEMAKQAVSAELDMGLEPIFRVFIYIPFEHSENLSDQNRAVSLFDKLGEEAGAEFKMVFDNYIAYAVRHQAVIERFGRFPHRNAILGRDSTDEELKFLKQPGSSF